MDSLPSPNANSAASVNSVSAESFWKLTKQFPVIDVRSPGEFEQGHIVDAINLPLFSNEQRAEIGITYKTEGRQPAVLKGLDFIGPQLAQLVSRSIGIANTGRVLVHCWRGGMRSQSFAQILELAGLQPIVLQGGYKAYRSLARSTFDLPMKLLVVSGLTGAGKTGILQVLESGGEQVIDLERLANHRGSAFGGIGQLPQPTTEQFENILFRRLTDLDLSKPIWIEDEGNRVGSAILPPPLYHRLQRSPAVSIECSLEQRVRNLVLDYGDLPKEQLIQSIEKIRKRLGGLAVKKAIGAVESGDVGIAIEIVLAYYDKTYNSAMASMPRETTLTLNVERQFPKVRSC